MLHIRSTSPLRLFVVVSWAWLILSSLIFSDCWAVAFNIRLLDPMNQRDFPVVSVGSMELTSLDSTVTFTGTKLTLPGEVGEVAYDHESRIVLITYSDKKYSPRKAQDVDYELDGTQALSAESSKGTAALSADKAISTPKKVRKFNRLVLFDLDSTKVRWAGVCRFVYTYRIGERARDTSKLVAAGHCPIDKIAFLSSHTAILTYAMKNVECGNALLDVKTGVSLGDWGPGLTAVSDSAALSVTSKKLYLVDLRTGRPLWEKKEEGFWGYPRCFQTGGWAYIVDGGLHAFRLDTGEGWYHAAHIASSPLGKELAGAVVTGVIEGIIMGMTGYTGFFVPYYSGAEQVPYNICSFSLVDSSRVYFAAGRTLSCIDRETGTVLWDVRLERELGATKLQKVGSSIALIGMGYKYVGSEIQEAPPPSIALFATDSGEKGAQVRLKDCESVLDCKWTEEGAFLLTCSHVYHFDSDLRLTGTLDELPECGGFLRFLPSDDDLVIRTYGGVVAVSQRSLEPLWSSEISFPFETPGDEKNESSVECVSLSSLEAQKSRTVNGVHWLAGPRGLAAVNLEDKGRVLTELALKRRRFTVSEEGDVIAVEGNSVGIVHLGSIN